MIKAENLNKIFSDNHVLKDISAVFEPGKTNLIIGQSGSGKTVFLNCLVGLHKVNSGKIYYDNLDFTHMTEQEKKHMRKDVGMLFQGSALFDSFTVEENIRFPLDMFSDMSLEEQQERVNFCLERVNLHNVNHLYPSEISGGMQKRVAIARAIVQNPKYLFCDEPNSGLDPKTAILIDKLIRDITIEFNMTTIINTHDMNSVMEIGDHVIFIFNGEKYWEGSNKEIFSANNKELNDFIFASNFAKKVKEAS